MHDPRVGRFFAVDPLSWKYSHNSPYAFSENIVIHGVELEGLEVNILTEENELLSGPFNMSGPRAGAKPLEEVVQDKDIEETFVKLYIHSETFVNLIKEQDFYGNVTVIPEYDNTGARTSSQPNYDEDGKTYFETTTIYLGVLSGGASKTERLAWEVTNSNNYLNGEYANVLDKVFFDDNYSASDYLYDASLIEAEAGFNAIVAVGEIVENRVGGTWTFNSKGDSFLSQFDGMTLVELNANKDAFIEAYGEHLRGEGMNTRENYLDDYDAVRFGASKSDSYDQGER